ncbi:MAG: KH domain-containing protein [Clostridia bacterium]|nr:KH domain-containing protein [Clostridia bacterium]
MNSIEVSAKNVEQAIEIGLFKLGVARENVKVAVLSEGGLFDKAKVRLIVNDPNAEASETELLVNEFVEKMKLNVVASVVEDEEGVKIDFAGTDIGTIIGKRGETLDSVQYLLGQMINKGKTKQESRRVFVDCSGYREKREGTLRVLAHRMADKAVRERRISKLEPMNAYERRIIHLALEGRGDVKTESQNKAPNRFITIIPNNLSTNTKEARSHND